mmetsp:Transcript_85072/g.245680  ORF Transcript_85072/g.245680 Transcript_85072/m.245680 type:complete len:228 (-) Transcript_85072:6-689(-)|eukprot:CAMPEP_0170274432 /NCGR_PEP_ID=MMETSP0116_2-20130129/37187_1 /TAXON_ID=400756 /ORGANISM="Durinskia baltica, Strain CSIRO CS-38" /LENGTH=227 /DNA_ID=CAMNT_0010525677 /DNA_START=82 /DNA_END=761 /DNA_ORIENTATION=+
MDLQATLLSAAFEEDVVNYAKEGTYSEDELLRVCLDLRPLSEILEAFASNIMGEAEGLPADPWGEKVGHSIFDEDEVLGREVPWEELLGDYEEEDDGDAEDLSEWSEDQSEEMEAHEHAVRAWHDRPSFDELPSCDVPKDAVPRAVKLIQPLCCVYTLEQDLSEECAICLDALASGQGAWRMPCTHILHEACAVRFFGARRVKAACPICRCNIKSLVTAAPVEAEAA